MNHASGRKFISISKTQDMTKRIRIVLAITLVLEIICMTGIISFNSKLFYNTQNLAKVPAGTVEVVHSQKGTNVETDTGKYIVNQVAYISSWAYDKDKTNWVTDPVSRELAKDKHADLYYTPDSLLFKKIRFTNVWWQYTLMYLGLLFILVLSAYQLSREGQPYRVLDIVLMTASSIFYIILLLMGILVLI